MQAYVFNSAPIQEILRILPKDIKNLSILYVTRKKVTNFAANTT